MSDDAPLTFFVPGLAKPAGSKKGFYIEKIKRVVITDDSGKPGKLWRNDVKHFAYEAMQGRQPVPRDVPLCLAVLFVMPRPQGHYGTGRNAGVLRPWTSLWPVTKPDATKLIRSAEDAMTGIAWVDDAQVVGQFSGKVYGERIGAYVGVLPMTPALWQRLLLAVPLYATTIPLLAMPMPAETGMLLEAVR